MLGGVVAQERGPRPRQPHAIVREALDVALGVALGRVAPGCVLRRGAAAGWTCGSTGVPPRWRAGRATSLDADTVAGAGGGVRVMAASRLVAWPVRTSSSPPSGEYCFRTEPPPLPPLPPPFGQCASPVNRHSRCALPQAASGAGINGHPNLDATRPCRGWICLAWLRTPVLWTSVVNWSGLTSNQHQPEYRLRVKSPPPPRR